MPIIKSKSIKSQGAYPGVLEYVLRKDAQYIDKDGKTLFLKHNLLGKPHEIKRMTKQFLDVLDNRIVKRKDNKSIDHIIISFHPDNTKDIDVTKLKAFAKQFVELRGKNTLYLFTAHQDRDHHHLHCITSPVQLTTGKSLRMSKQEFNNIQVKLQEWQEKHYPELEQSVINYENRKKKQNLSRLEQMQNIRLNKEKE